MGKLSKSALAEVAYQICIICLQPYSKELECRLLPCGHHYCCKCVALEVEKLLGEQDTPGKEDKVTEGQQTVFYNGKKTKPRFRHPEAAAPTLQCPICDAQMDATELSHE